MFTILYHKCKSKPSEREPVLGQRCTWEYRERHFREKVVRMGVEGREQCRQPCILGSLGLGCLLFHKRPIAHAGWCQGMCLVIINGQTWKVWACWASAVTRTAKSFHYCLGYLGRWASWRAFSTSISSLSKSTRITLKLASLVFKYKLAMSEMNCCTQRAWFFTARHGHGPLAYYTVHTQDRNHRRAFQWPNVYIICTAT